MRNRATADRTDELGSTFDPRRSTFDSAADGDSYEEAVKNARGIIREWISTARKLGRPVPLPKGELMYA